MALVHPRTQDLGPDEQAKGVYEYTPPEVLAYLNGEVLNEADLGLVTAYYQQRRESIPFPPKPAIAEVVDSNKGGGSGRSDAVGHTYQVQYGKETKRVLRQPAPTFNDPLQALRNIANASVASLPDADAYEILVSLAARFKFDIE